MFDVVRQDIRVALRLLRRSPLFTLTAAASLAVGIGANTAIFSVINALLLKSVPGVSSPAELVDVGRSRQGRGFDTSSYPNYLDLKQRVSALSDLAAYRVEPIAMSMRDPALGGEAERIYTTSASGNYFSVLGTRAEAGRLFAGTKDAAARVAPTMVISDALWDRKYQRDPSVIGRTVIVNGVNTVIVGVAETGFRGTSFMAADAWLPIGAHPVFNPGSDQMLTERRIVWLLLVGRLAPGATQAQVQAQLSTVARQLAAEHPDTNKDISWRLSASSVVPAPFQRPVSAFLAILMVIVGLVLLIACVNLAGVLLARGAYRQREISIRLAVGAGRGRLIVQLVTETLVIFAIGCAGGVLLSMWLTQLLGNLTEALPVPVAVDLAPDARVLMFAAGITFLSGLLSGLVPALQAARTDLVTAIKQDAAAQGFRRQRVRGALLVGQVALSCVVFLAAMLFTRSLQEAARIDQGFDSAHVDIVAMDFAMGGYRGADAARFGDELVQRTRALPGVEGAALTRMIPLSGGGMGLGGLAAVGHDPATEDIAADWNVVTPGYFKTLNIPILAGRDFTAADRDGAPAVAIVNATFAERVWPGQSAVGQRLVRETPEGKSELTVVGVARNGKYRTLGESPLAYIYVPHAQQSMTDMTLIVKSAGGAGGALPSVRAALHELNPNLPIIKAQSLSEAVSIALIPQRVAARLAGSLGMLGLLLAAFGIYGVTAYTVAQRTREIGVRVALGAPRAQVVGLILRQGLALTVTGVALGLATGALTARLLSSLLYGLGAQDPITFAMVGAIFLGIAGLASYVPARTAVKIDPLRALRVD